MNKQELLARLKEEGFAEPIVQAFANVKREKFLPDGSVDLAYEDTALPIGQGQTISQPSTIAFMLELLQVKPQQKILEVGSGSGYVLALLNQLSPDSEIYGAERVGELTELSKKRLAKIKNIQICYTPNKLGLSKQQPFDRILVSAAARQLPQLLINQLADNGLMVCPINHSIWQVKKQKGRLLTKEFPGFVFVPLIG